MRTLDVMFPLSTPLLIILNIAPFSTLRTGHDQKPKQYMYLLFSLTDVCDLNLHTQASQKASFKTPSF